ncbi:hypothetical protein EYZ11_008195 [Aspergillus tanneri]|uniref:Cytomegalovirus gH-receptor family protein n=1 Tax=Aspergillus tanneri TaxID=1220188 RepID=A0A4S3JB43_9EURO|nr:hypothetical protein EYZ11_008195 [Aspergillus tanneri]
MGAVSVPCNGVLRSPYSSADTHGVNNIPEVSDPSDFESPVSPTKRTMDAVNGDSVERPQDTATVSASFRPANTDLQGHRPDLVAGAGNPDEAPRKYRTLPSPHADQMQEKVANGINHAQPDRSAASPYPSTEHHDRTISDIKLQQNGISFSTERDHELRFPRNHALNGDRKGGQLSLTSDQASGMVFEHFQEGPSSDAEQNVHKNSLIDVFKGPAVATALDQLSGESSPPTNQEKDRDQVPKLSSAKIRELTSSPQSIPYRAAPVEGEQGRRVVSDGASAAVHQSENTGVESQPPNDLKMSLDHTPKQRPSTESSVDFVSGLVMKPSPSTARNRPQVPHTFSTPSSLRRQTLPSNERLSQAWASRSKQDRPTVSKDLETRHLHSSPAVAEPALPSPLPPSIPLPPLSVPTYLQLELASGRPSPLYIHRSAMSDFPYESSRVKLERLMNFLMLPPALEQVLWFGILAYTTHEQPRGLEPEARGRVTSGKQEQNPMDREVHNRASEPRRRRRTDVQLRYQHRRQKSTPSALLPDDKADILKGLLMITTCSILMYFDASRMYHWIRGQAAIKLYVIYNVLEVSDRLLAAIGQDVLECLFSREALERRPDGRSKVFRPFGLFLLALTYTVIHATALFFQVMTLNVAVNSYSNALITLLLSNQFVEIKSTVFKKFEKENLFQLTCADVVERFQLWLMLTIIASRNFVETGAFSFFGSLGSSFGTFSSTATNSTPLSTPPRTASSILPQSFTIVPSSIIASFSHVNSFLPTLAQVLGPFLVVLGSEMLVDWLKHAYINKFNNTRPAIYLRFLDILAKDYYTNAFGDQNLTRRLGLPVIPLSCLFFRVSVQTYQMFLASLLPQHPSSTAVSSTSLSSIHSHYVPAPMTSPQPLTIRTILPVSAAHVGTVFRQLLANTMPSPAQSVTIFTVVLLLTGFVLLLIFKLLLGMVLLAFARGRYKAMKHREAEHASSAARATAENGGPPRGREFAVEGSRRVGGWGMVEVNDDQRRWIYVDDPEALRRLKAKEEKDKNTKEEMNMDHVQRYEMVAKRIW